MGINRNQQHLTVLLEDRPYRALMNGVKQALNVNDHVLDVKNPSRGWSSTFEELKTLLPLLQRYPQKHILVLVDFDNQFSNRKEKFAAIISNEKFKNNVFLLGVNQKESEDLKRHFSGRNYEEIGRSLVESCPETENPETWRNEHLSCNLTELERMRNAGVFHWLFRKV